MTNGEKLCIDFPNMRYTISEHRVITTIGIAASFDLDWWNAEYKEPTNTIDYRRAFKIACDLLNGDILYGVDTDKIFELMMQKDGVVSSSSYEEYILNHLQELDHGQYASESVTSTDSTTKNDLEVEECISRRAALEACHNFAIGVLDDYYEKCLKQWIIDLPPATPQPIEKCKWIKYDHRTMFPKEHDVANPYWRIPENRMEALKYCPYCGKKN